MSPHLTTEALLAIRDREAPPPAHLAECAQCQHALAGLRQVRAQLAALPVLRSRRDGWPAVRRAVVTRRRVLRGALLGGALAAAAGVFAVALAPPSAGPYGRAPLPVAPVTDEVASLVRESQSLESTLALIREHELVVDGTSADTVVELEEQIGSLDQALQELRADAPPAATAGLWKARVELLRALVELKGASSVVSL